MKKKLTELGIGDSVRLSGRFGETSIETITNISFKYNELTGVKYKIIHIGSDQYNSINGEEIPETNFSISTL